MSLTLHRVEFSCLADHFAALWLTPNYVDDDDDEDLQIADKIILCICCNSMPIAIKTTTTRKEEEKKNEKNVARDSQRPWDDADQMLSFLSDSDLSCRLLTDEYTNQSSSPTFSSQISLLQGHPPPPPRAPLPLPHRKKEEKGTFLGVFRA